ncbi:MAG: hypothetical protein GY940_18340, partial [bacterium]|nr:hypothetical protein [bacterium]
MKFNESSARRFFAIILPCLALTFFSLQLPAVRDDRSVDASSQMGNILLDAHRKGRRIPVLSVQFPELDGPAAYRVQRYYVKHRLSKDQIVGFKAGLTSAASMKRFG